MAVSGGNAVLVLTTVARFECRIEIVSAESVETRKSV
jgi:hypothetical protein